MDEPFVTNAYGDLKRVIMHRPGRELTMVNDETLAEFHFDRPVNSGAFVSEYDTMLGLFQAHGVETLLLTDILKEDRDSMVYMARRPNMTYMRDLASVFSRGAVLMAPHLKGRWGDQLMIARAFRRLGVPILGAIDPPGFLEGGGVTMLGDDTAVVSLCDRANETGTRMLREIILGKDVKYFVEVPLPFGHIHINGVFMVLDRDLALIYPDSFRIYPCRLYEDGKSEPRHVMFEELLSERGIRTLRRAERAERHLNVVVTKRSETAIGFSSATRIGSGMARNGWRLVTFPADELFKGNGGAHCMTCPISVG